MDPKGWYSRGYLPHFDSPETVQFVTFRLADSLPKAVVQALATLPDNLAQTDERLDAGWGDCWLARSEIAELVEGALLHFDKDRYRLLAWCIMPNHVHAVVEPTDRNALDRIVHSWKSFTATSANQVLGRSGAFWHRDYFDRFIRDEGHLNRTIEYVENNPVKAGLVSEPAQWRWSSARLRP
jgi:REP element-mobilizing transposase RayT